MDQSVTFRERVYTLHLTLKIYHAKMTKICHSWKRDSISELVYLQHFLLDLSG